MRTGWMCWKVAIVTGVLVSPTQAAIKTFTVSGIVGQVTDPSNYLGGGVLVGHSFVASYSFDTTTPDLLPTDGLRGRYATMPPMPVVIGPLFLNASDSLFIDVLDAPAGDGYGVIGHFTSTGFEIVEFNLALSGGPSSLFSSDALPLNPPPLNNQSSFFVQGHPIGHSPSVDDFLLSGKITAIVPEATSFVLLVVCGTFLLTHRPQRAVSQMIGAAGPLFFTLTSTLSAQTLDMIFVLDESDSIRRIKWDGFDIGAACQEDAA